MIFVKGLFLADSHEVFGLHLLRAPAADLPVRLGNGAAELLESNLWHHDDMKRMRTDAHDPNVPV